ncbi:MAG: TRAP transporter small permease subunit [Verrucomicrobiales bacterium]|jgi:TRAP-type mannitol/chloroaromatic compound transport system permease small subunit|nr:TRAP transporter small permease subunit [Verrucomicrobiales bacterium]
MLKFLRNYVRAISAVNRAVGIFAMYLLALLLGVLAYSIVSNNLFNRPGIWVMEMAQFTMAAYYLLGAGYSLQEGAHVRMDFLYERWTPKRRALMDCFTVFFVIFYLVIMIKGGVQSSWYAIEYGQRNHTVWAPYMAPIKIIMTLGMALMLLQAVAELIKDVFTVSGHSLTEPPPDAANDAPSDVFFQSIIVATEQPASSSPQTTLSAADVSISSSRDLT